MDVLVKRLCAEAKIPTYARAHDAGFDLFTIEKITLQPGERTQVKTGIALAVPSGCVGLIWDKSGLSHTAGLKTLGGVIDAGYRGEVMVGIVNLGDTPHTFEAGEKVAQMLIQKIEQAMFAEVDTLDETERGDGAFGSTGK
jgi:dUTP pyrophosphatase